MNSKKVGIEDARKRLGDLVTAAQQGTDIILTRNGKPAARIVSYQEDTMVFSQESPSTPIADGGYVYDPEADGPDFRGFTAEELRVLTDERGLDFSAHPAIVIAEQVGVARAEFIAVCDEVNAFERQYRAAGRVVDQYVDSKDPEGLAKAEAAFADQERMREQGRRLAEKRNAAQQRLTEAEIAWFDETQPDV